MSRIPEIIAHRGAPREALENTLAAFEIALDQNADGVELDVHATMDGTVVVHHDADVPWPVASSTTRRPIADIDAKRALAYALRDNAHMPTLDAVLDLIGERSVVYIEVKATGIERPLLAVLNRHPKARVAVHSFDHRVPVAVRAARPSTRIGLLSASYPISLDRFIGAAKPDAFWQQANLIDQALVEETHALGARLIAWTVNDAQHAHALIAMGVDALCTDTPALLRAALLAP